LLLIASSFFLGTKISNAQNDQCSTDPHTWPPPQIDFCLKQLTSALDSSLNATRPLESQLNALQTEIKGIKDRLSAIEGDLVIKRQNIDKGYKDLTAKTEILNTAIQDIYKKQSGVSPLTMFISSKNVEDFLRSLSFQQAIISHDREIVVNFALLLTDLETQKKSLESEEAQLTSLKANLDDQSSKLDKIVSGAKAYQANLSSQIAQLSAIQQQVLGQRLSDLGISLYASMAGGCSSDIGKLAPFSNGFGAFTYGVPNRVGLNQYGAKGRAEAGQKYPDILNAYYANFQMGNLGNPNITVSGNNDYGESVNQTWDLETYLQHIYEVSASWPTEALRAQAIAARSYVLAYTNNGSSPICADQHCQEVKLTPHDSPCDGWCQAVKDTAGQVMVQGGSAIKAWFSSTHGGYVFSSGDIGWSSTSWTKEAQDASGPISSFSDLTNNAYDKGSPLFYCDWGSRSNYNNTAWLTNDEFADIINVLLLVQADSSTKEHLYQVDRANPAGTDTWDAGRVKQELQNRNITPFNSVSSISVSADFGGGRVNSVNVSGNRTATFVGSDFKSYFNLRAPAKIQIVGPLYNIEPEH